MIPDCAAEPMCRYWDVNTSSWGNGGVEMQSFNPESGGVVCATKHLTDFAVVSDSLVKADAFFESAMELEVNLPRPLSLEELLAVLTDINPEEYVGVVLAVIAALSLMWAAARYDDRRAYVEFFPRWHQRLGSSGPMALQAIGAQLIILLTSNHFFAVFFVLPSMPIRRVPARETES